MKLEEKTKQFIEKHHMLAKGAGVLVGLSGGADSVALLEVLCALREVWELRVAAVHVHHGIRAEAQVDADFCRALCESRQVEFYCEYADVPDVAKALSLTLEEAGRKVRYEIFDQYRQCLGLDVIAVAHHQNDQAETMLFQLFRGSGLKGMAGMPVRRGDIIRPLLGVTRAEIEEYLQEKRIDYVTDATNLTDLYARNKIRLHVLPVAEEISAGAVEHMNRTGAQFREILDFLEQEGSAFLEKHGEQHAGGQWVVQAEALKSVHPALQKTVILMAMEQAFFGRKDITERHVEAVRKALDKQGEKHIHLPNGCVVTKSYDRLIFARPEIGEVQKNDRWEALEIKPDSTYFLPDGRVLETKVFPYNKLENIPKSDCNKWFDYDKISGVLVLRCREQGDFLTVHDNGSRKSLQDYLVNEKVPKSMRDTLPVLADAHHIVWIPGMRISAYYKVTAQTRNVLQIYIGGKQDGRESRSIN